MYNEFTVNLIKAAEQMLAFHDKAHELTHKLENENVSRVVWFVGISGFAILNMPNVFSDKSSLTFLDFLPWILTVIFGVMAHWSHRNVSIENYSFFIAKRESLMSFILGGANNATHKKFEEIMLNKTDVLQDVSKKLDRASGYASQLERLTFLSFLAGLLLFVSKYMAQVLQ